MRLLTIALVSGMFLSAGCGKKGPSVTVEPAPVTAAADAVATVEDAAAPAEEVAPAPVEKPILPPSEKEKTETWDQFLTEGTKFVKSMSNERIDILTQMREIKFEKETEGYKAQINTLADKLQDFELGDTPEKLETAVDRMCTLITEMRAESDKLSVAGKAELEQVNADLKALDDKKAAGGDVTQKQFDKLTDLQKRLSGPPLAARYVLLTVKSLLDEAMVIVDYGVHRARRKLVECLTTINERPLELELAQGNLEHVLKRAKKLLAVPLE